MSLGTQACLSLQPYLRVSTYFPFKDKCCLSFVTLSGRDKDPEKKKTARDILANKHLPKWFQFLENLLKQNTKSVYFVESNITIADLAIWRLLGWLKSGMLDGIPTTILDNYQNLNALREEIYKNPKVIKWMDEVYGKII